MLTVWTEPSGYSFGILQEQVTVNLALPVSNDSGVTYTVISGTLPGGLRISGNHIVGTPYIISSLTNYLFCIRASNGTDFADRTFGITINGVNPPVFVTPAGDLAIGPSQQFYALDSTFVSYQLEAYDLNTASGATLSYFIGSEDGQLPPGLTLSKTGLISGFIEPALIVTPSDGSGTYAESLYDAVAFDFAQLPTDGFDSYVYDDVFFDFNQPVAVPLSLNANYQFRVTITDGISYAQRVFKIFVVGTDEFRADSTTLDGLADSFTADSTYLRKPMWLTQSDLGTYRANNYVTVPVALYDKTDTIFRLEATNEEVYAVTYQVTGSDNEAGSTSVTVSNVKGTPIVGYWFTFDNYISNATEQIYLISNVTSLGNDKYRLTITTPLAISLKNGVPFYIGTKSKLPPGISFDVNTGEIYGRIPYQQAVILPFTFTITASRLDPINTNESVTSARTFTIKILGDVNSLIVWNSNKNLGSLPAGYVSTLNVSASSSVTGAVVTYNLISGSLPPGLSLNVDGEIIGTPNQYHYVDSNNVSHPGLVTFDGAAMTFDGNFTTFDKVYTFVVEASDQFGYSAVTREFSLTLTTPNTVQYSNITTQPFLIPAQRAVWQNFISDSSIFPASSVYRINDPAFGLQKNLTMLVYAGIQTEEAAAYVGAMGLNHKRKRFQFGSIEKAVAIDPVTDTEVYEVIYMQMVDPLEYNGKHLPLSITAKIGQESETITVDDSNSIWSMNLGDLESNAPADIRPDLNITVDSSGYQVSNPKATTYFPNSISNWQQRLGAVGLTERNYLPLWMRTIQSGSKQQLGYVLAVPICFCKLGTADTILLNIKNNGFKFNSLDYTVDRFIISAVTGDNTDKYIVFRNDRITV